MSIPGLSLGISAAEAGIFGALQTMVYKPKRGFTLADGTLLTPQITIEEHHRDELTITDHPVERGANISDHIFLNPRSVVIRCGWSASPSPQSGLFGTFSNMITGLAGTLDPFGDPLIINRIYDKLRALQVSGKPFALFTGKRQYQNMLIRSLGVHTDKESENALLVEADCREVIITQTYETNVPTANQANVASTGQNPTTKGQVSLAPAPLYVP